MGEIKFRQPLKPNSLGEAYHYWGYIDGSFVAPMGNNYASGDSEQYTGMTDRNGVEIYKGDVVECSNYHAWVVKFINGCFVACNPWGDLHFVSLDDYDFKVI